MGSAASVPVGPLESWTLENVALLVNSIGAAYEGYGAIFISECINGVFLAKLNDAELKETLADLGITKGLHVKNICAQFESLKTTAGGGRSKATSESRKTSIDSKVVETKKTLDILSKQRGTF